MSEKEWQEEHENANQNPIEEKLDESAADLPQEAPTPDAQAESAPEPQYEYRWSYADQKAFDDGQLQKKRKKGAWTYAIVMAAAFLVCFAMLIGVVVWYEMTGRRERAYGGLTVGEVSEMVSPATVLIYSYQSTNDKNPVAGTGFFIREDGYIATNYHVIEGGKKFKVTLYSAEVLDAELVGYSKDNDLAILKVEGHRYPVITVGNSDTVEVGDAAVVIGNPSGAHGAWTTTQGIVSAVDRPSTINGKRCYMIQTDAAINGGNSGGPLCNDQGEVIGVVTQIMLDGNGDRNEGFGMAITINKAMSVLEDILKKNHVD